MARDRSPKCKQCRREGMKLFLKGERCLTEKCAIERRSYPPGEHGRGRIKQSEYLLQQDSRSRKKITNPAGFIIWAIESNLTVPETFSTSHKRAVEDKRQQAESDQYYQRVGFNTLYYALLAIGLNVVVGWAGLLDLGYVAFFGLGAYTYAFLDSNGHHWPPLATMAIAISHGPRSMTVLFSSGRLSPDRTPSGAVRIGRRPNGGRAPRARWGTVERRRAGTATPNHDPCGRRSRGKWAPRRCA